MPFPREIETERLRLRQWCKDDLETLTRWNADAIVMAHMGRPPMSSAETEAHFARVVLHWREHGFGTWAAEEKASARLIGRIGLSFHSEWPEDPEVGWTFDPAYWNRGFATEAGAAAIQVGFHELGVTRIVSICTPENVASRRVMEKLGLRLLAKKTHREFGVPLWIHAVERGATGAGPGTGK